MSHLNPRRIWRHCLVGALAFVGIAAQAAPPQIATIDSTPLVIRVGDDASFQILNSQVPGVGQMYPSDSTGTADLGWFVRVGTTLYAPRFEEHPDGTATTGLGAYTPFTPVSLSAVTGAGTAQAPFRVTVVNDLGNSGLRATLQVSYTRNLNYMSQHWTLRNTGATEQAVKIFYAGDIYLADSDDGVPYLANSSNSPGGKNCPGTPTEYFVLLIPQTPANAYAARSYNQVWTQIGEGQLDNAVVQGCTDNGAGLQWNRTLAAGAATTIATATSFGDVPDIAQFNLTEVNPAHGQAGQTVSVTLTGIGFRDNSLFDFGPGITLSNLIIVNATTATAVLTIDNDAALGARDVTGREHPEGVSATLDNGFTVLAPGELPPGTLQFGATTYSVHEDAGTLTVTVTRINGSQGAASIDYRTEDGTAQAGSDYTATQGSLQWESGDTAPKTFAIAITDDTVAEANETFTLHLSNATGATTGTPLAVTVTIIDNDSPTPLGGNGKLKSGGAFGGGLLVVLATALSLRKRRRALLLIAALALPGTASAGDWYLGLRAGTALASHDSGQLNLALRARGHTVTTEVDDKSFGGALYLGYRLQPQAALEVGYLRLGSYDTRLSGNLGSAQILLDDAATVFQGNGDALLLALRLDYPLYGPLSFTPRLGGYWWRSETELETTAGRISTDKQGLGLQAGVGFSVGIGSHLRLGLNSELLRASSHGAQQLHTLQIEYAF